MNPRTAHPDTSSEAMTLVTRRWREASPAEKLDHVTQLNETCARLAEAGVRARHPGASDHEVHLRVVALHLGRELMVAAYGWDPTVEGW